MGTSGYVRGLRAKIGHDLLLLPGVVALVRDEDARLLLVQHADGRWQLPGGAVDPGERPADALRRECREEAGVDVELLGIVGAVGGPEHRVTYANGDEVEYVIVVYAARIAAGTPAPGDDETRAVAWVSQEELETVDLRGSARALLAELLDPVCSS